MGRFARYVERTWGFADFIRRVRDKRPRRRIPPSSIFLSIFGLFSTRLPSFNALEQQLKIPQRWEPFIGPRLPSADTLGYSLERFDLNPPRDFLAEVAHQARRKKALERLKKNSRNPYTVAALDGHELWCSFKRSCLQCLTRDIDVKGQTVTQYYHRVVALQLVGVTPALMLDYEPILPGEDEVAAAIRIVRRIRERYPRLIDILSVDAAYLEAPFTRAALEERVHLVTVLKQENRDLYQDVRGLLRNAPEPVVIAEPDKTILQWDFEDLPSWPQLGRSVRVVCQREATTRGLRVAGQRQQETRMSDWWWMTTMPTSLACADWIAEAGHARWDVENRGFNELSAYWAMDHCFHHDPTTIIALLLIQALAFGLTTLFFDRNLKPQARQNKTRLFLAQRLMEDLILGAVSCYWSPLAAQPNLPP